MALQFILKPLDALMCLPERFDRLRAPWTCVPFACYTTIGTIAAVRKARTLPKYVSHVYCISFGLRRRLTLIFFAWHRRHAQTAVADILEQ